MIIYPDYYPEFKCIANECKHNCCIGWEIDIDEPTMHKYRNFSGKLGIKLKNNIACDNGTYHFILSENERCPFLNSKNLCEIIESHGEEMLCQICRDHPRFRNCFEDRTEIGLGLCCEEAARIILTKENKVRLVADEDIIITDNFYEIRNEILGIVQDRSKPITERVENLLDTFGATNPLKLNKDWSDIFRGLERLNPVWNSHLDILSKNKIYTEKDDIHEIPYEQLVVYLIYRHLSECIYDGLFTERLSFIALCFYVIRAMNIQCSIDKLIEISVLFSSEIEYSDENIERITNHLR